VRRWHALALAVGALCLYLGGGSASAATCGPATSAGTAPSDWATYCWLDFSTYNDALARSAGGQSFSFTLQDGSTLNLTATVTTTAATALTPVAVPSWTGAAVGNTAFLGIPGKPVLYTTTSGSTVTVTFSGITLTPPAGVTAGATYSFVGADGESTNQNESLAWTTNGGNWTLLDKVPPITGNTYPTVTNTGTTFTETGVAGTVGAYIVGSLNPTQVTTVLVAGGLQGSMFAVRYSTISLNKQLASGRVNPADQFTYNISATASGTVLGTATSTGAGNGPFTATSSFLTTQQSLTLSEAMAAGSVSTLANYTPTLTCTNANSSSSTPLPTNVNTTSYVIPSINFGDAISCLYTNTKLVPGLAVTKSAPSPALKVGVSSTYTLTVTNTGAVPATTAQVKDQLPANLTFISALGTNWTCTAAGSLLTCQFAGGTIAVGGTSTIAVTVSAPVAAGGTTDTNYASIDPTGGNAAPAPGAGCTPAGDCANSGPSTVIYINAQPASGTATAGTAATPIANTVASDTVNGASATLGAAGNATISQSGTWPTGIALNTTTGAVTTTAGVGPGTYSIIYQLCDRDTPPDCATATDTVTVNASIVPAVHTGTAVAGTASTPIANVATGGTVNGSAATLGPTGNATVAQSGTWPAGIALNTTSGAVTTTVAVPPGSYSITYQLCDRSTPPNCATATDTVTVTASIIPATASGTAVAGTASTPIANVAAGGTVNGAAATLGAGGNATVAQSGTWPAGITLNTTSGAVTTTAAVPPGSYSITYQLCDRSTPPNCATATDTVTVSASILPAVQTGTAVAGTASTPIANVATGGTVNGSAATLGAGGNATVAQSGTWPAGITLNTTTGAVTTTAAVAPGSYSITYQLCDRSTPPNCATATDTVTVSASIVPVAKTGTAVAGTASTPIANVATGGTVNGSPATLGAGGNATVAQSGAWPAGIALNTTSGAITTTAAVPPGTYPVVYQLCDRNTPPNCATATDTVGVNASIVPATATGTAVAGTPSTPIANVAAGGTVNGSPATLGAGGNATVAQSGAWPAGLTLNTTSGAVTTSAALAPGSYAIAYQLCDRNTPPNCATATDTVTVSANILPAAQTGTATAGTASTPIANVATGGTVNGAPATLGAGGNATVAQSGTWPAGLALNTSTGAVTTTAAVPPGSYSLVYQLCDRNTPPNCATATDTVTVNASILPAVQTGTATAGTASTPIANVVTGGTVNGAAPTLGAGGNATVAQSGAWPAGIALNTTTGAVTTTAAVAPGSYSIAYQLCDRNTPPNCATATDTVTVKASILPAVQTGTAVAGTASTPIANVVTGGTVNGTAATLGAGGNATVAQSGAWPPGIALNTTSGAITTTAAVPPGTYPLTYQLCDRNSPPNCATASDTVTVTANIVPVAQSGTAVAGVPSTPIADVATGSTVNGSPAVLGASGNATVAPSGSWPTGIALNTTTGAVTTTAAVPPGSYSIAVQLCDKSTPANCATVTDNVKVTANIIALAQSGSAVSGVASTPIANVATHDTVNGSAATLGAGGNATVAVSGTWPGGIALNTTSGAVTVTASVVPGTYAIAYQLCDRNTPPDCATATDSVKVVGGALPVVLTGTAVAGIASAPIPNIVAGATVDGVAATLGASGNATVSTVGTWPNGLTLNATTGAIWTTVALIPGTYQVRYQLCNRLTPASCAVATDTVTVTAPVGGTLMVNKTASVLQAAIGDSVQYRLQVRNAGTGVVADVKLLDTLPLGFKLIAGTVQIGVEPALPKKAANPQGTPGPELSFFLGNIAPGAIVDIYYEVRLGVGADRGSGINQAQAQGAGVHSLVATAQVLVSLGAFDTSACVVGKIFVDCNGNRVQDAGEPGIPGVRLYFEDGTNLTSDEHGNYSLCGLRPITHVLKVDATTLPAGSRLVVLSNRNAGDGNSVFVDLRDGELHRADFAEGSCTDKVMEDVKRRRAKPVLAPQPPAGKEHLGVDFESKPTSSLDPAHPGAPTSGDPGERP
jgi:uncharacterized repeat protein (TIGR01451 family)